jgi:hypothetical protein
MMELFLSFGTSIGHKMQECHLLIAMMVDGGDVILVT